MPTQNDDLWRGWESTYFNDGGGFMTPDISSLKSTVAENRQILNMLFMIDVSGSMRGKRIAQVNYALENIFKELRRRDDLHSTIKVGLMEFCRDAEWITPQPMPLDDIVFTEIDTRQQITCYGAAFDRLNEKLSREGFFNPNLGEYFAPLILFVTDGEPVDAGAYPAALERLKRNGWFNKASKYAIAVGEDARLRSVGELLARFTGVRENVRYADEGEALYGLIEFIAVRGSEVQTSMVSSMEDDPRRMGSLFKEPDPSLFSSMFNA